MLDTTVATWCLDSLAADTFSPAVQAANGNSLTNSLYWIATRPETTPAGSASAPASPPPSPEANAPPPAEPAQSPPPRPLVASERPREPPGGATAAAAALPEEKSRPLCVEVDTSYEPLDMVGQSQSREPSMLACQQRCARTFGCTHFTYWMDGGCHLQDENSHAFAETGKWNRPSAGPATCDGWVAPPPSEERAWCYEPDARYEPLNMAGQERSVEANIWSSRGN